MEEYYDYNNHKNNINNQLVKNTQLRKIIGKHKHKNIEDDAISSSKISKISKISKSSKVSNLSNKSSTEKKDRKNENSSNISQKEKDKSNFVSNNAEHIPKDLIDLVENYNRLKKLIDLNPDKKKNCYFSKLGEKFKNDFSDDQMKPKFNVDKKYDVNLHFDYNYKFDKNSKNIINNYEKNILSNKIDNEKSKRENKSEVLRIKSIKDEPNEIIEAKSINTKVRLINKIAKESIDTKNLKIDIRRFIKLPDNATFNIISFLNDNYSEISKSSKLLASKFQISLINLFGSSIESFRNAYGSILDLQEYYFQSGVFKKSKNSAIPVLDLVLRSKICDKNRLNKDNCNLTIYFTLDYAIKPHTDYYKKENISISWQFDVMNSKELNMWFASEAEEYRNSLIRYSYSQPIKSFCMGDIVEIKINLINSNSRIINNTLKWQSMSISAIQNESFKNYHKGIQRNYIKFDNYRFCEFENIVHIWKTLKKQEKIPIVEEFKYCFNNCFEIENIYYDNLKFNIFKVVMKATNVGIIFKNKFLNLNLEVVDKSKHISNEIQCLGILSIQQIKQITQVRINDEIWFYFTDFQ